MASTATPYGFRAVNELGGLPYAGSTRQFLINPAGYNTNIFNGSLVFVNASGFLQIATSTGADATTNGFPTGTANTGCIGVFVGWVMGRGGWFRLVVGSVVVAVDMLMPRCVGCIGMILPGTVGSHTL
jgi:hypothetical protein